jgi:hypothetical protein
LRPSGLPPGGRDRSAHQQCFENNPQPVRFGDADPVVVTVVPFIEVRVGTDVGLVVGLRLGVGVR